VTMDLVTHPWRNMRAFCEKSATCANRGREFGVIHYQAALFPGHAIMFFAIPYLIEIHSFLLIHFAQLLPWSNRLSRPVLQPVLIKPTYYLPHDPRTVTQ
jgi:hypothetical protein